MSTSRASRALKPVVQSNPPGTPGTQVRILNTELEKKDNENDSLQNTITDLTKALDSLNLVKSKTTTAFSKETTAAAAAAAGAKKTKKDPNAPEPAKTAYRYFCQQLPTPTTEAAKPDGGGAAVDTRLLWKECQGDVRKMFTDLAATDKQRFEQENAVYQHKLAEQQEQDAALDVYYEKQKQQAAMEFYEAHLAAEELVKNGKKKKKQSKKDPDAPKRAMTSYLYFVMEKREEVATANPEISFTEISKMLGEMWGKLEKGKRGKNGTKKYDDLAAKDKQRYEAENEIYQAKLAEQQKESQHERALQLELDKEEAMKLMLEIQQEKAAATEQPVAAEPSSTKAGKKVKKIKKVGAPKKASSAYIYFAVANRAQIKAGLPETTTNQELLTEVGRQWRELDDAGRVQYTDLAAQDKERYQKELLAFEEKEAAAAAAAKTDTTTTTQE